MIFSFGFLSSDLACVRVCGFLWVACECVAWIRDFGVMQERRIWLQSRKTFAFLLGFVMKAGVRESGFLWVEFAVSILGNLGILVLCARLVKGFMIGEAVLQADFWYIKLGVTYCVQVVAMGEVRLKFKNYFLWRLNNITHL